LKPKKIKKIRRERENDTKGDQKTKKPKILKFKVASHMRGAAEKILQIAVSMFDWNISRKIECLR
jgi:hypothetical protein